MTLYYLDKIYFHFYYILSRYSLLHVCPTPPPTHKTIFILFNTLSISTMYKGREKGIRCVHPVFCCHFVSQIYIYVSLSLFISFRKCFSVRCHSFIYSWSTFENVQLEVIMEILLLVNFQVPQRHLLTNVRVLSIQKKRLVTIFLLETLYNF